LKPTSAALEGLAGRFARTHSPFVAAAICERWAVPESLVREALQSLETAATVVHGDFRPGGVEREWCDAEVLRMLRRRSLARLRREVEAVDGAALARFAVKWQGVGGAAGGLERLREVLAQLEGVALPASVLERDLLPARVSGYQPRLLDELCAAGEVAWVGRGRLGKDDGRVSLVPRERLFEFAAMPAEEDTTELQAAILELLQRRGALFFTEFVPSTMRPAREVLDALWELAWAGAVTNDTFAPVRALAWPKRAAPSPRTRTRGLPPESSGRWSATASPGQELPSATARAHRLATTLLERHGVVTRETVASEGVVGGFSAVYPVLKAMEDGGRIRRGYFVEGLGAAQFALPGAVERLRAERERPEEPRVVVLAATDPANPYGATLPWPKREEDQRRQLQRAAGAQVVLVDGEPVVYLDRSGRGITTLPAFDSPNVHGLALAGLLAAFEQRGGRGLKLERIDGLQAADSPVVEAFLAGGFTVGYRGLTYRPPTRGAAVAGGR
ncbi:MAG: DEAD/DEAH box helicase, partial [Tepidiformaceae bacterium]